MTQLCKTTTGPSLPINMRAMLDCIEADLKGWLPGRTATCCANASLDFPISDTEKAMVANAVRSRHAEFITARWCAHRALEKIESPTDLIPADQFGAPQWPAKITGSITHESGICLAVVAQTSAISGIGVDLFDIRRKTDMTEIGGLVLSKEEAVFCGPAVDDASYLKLAFSAKEAVVKAVSAKAGRLLDMREIRLSIGVDSFQAGLNGFPYRITGRWGNVGPFILTLAILEH